MNGIKNSVIIRLSYRMIALCVLFTLFTVIIGWGIVFINTEVVYMEDGTTIPIFLKVVITLAASIVEIGCLFIIIPMWKRIFKDGAMTLTQNGIENTFMIFTLFAFWTTIRIKFIPWSALEIDDTNEDDCIIVDVKQLSRCNVGIIAKFMLKIFGFNFKIGRIKKAELNNYRLEALACNDNTTT